MRRLDEFSGSGYDKGRHVGWQIAWQVVSGAIVMRWWCPSRVRVAVLRAFGATIGDGTNIRHRVRIHWPWKLSVGDHAWIGEGAWLLNLEPITIGEHTCISQDAFVCAGSHDRRSPSFEFDNAPIVIGRGVWVAARAVILRGVTVGDGATVGAAALVTKDVDPGAEVFADRR